MSTENIKSPEKSGKVEERKTAVIVDLYDFVKNAEKREKASQAVDIVGVIGSSPTNPTTRKP